MRSNGSGSTTGTFRNAASKGLRLPRFRTRRASGVALRRRDAEIE
jgi:hypothetical protein